MSVLPNFVDVDLWFEHQADVPPHRDYLIGRCHTHWGRMRSYCPPIDRTMCVSFNEMTRTSTAAAWWIKGFLSGNEPSIHDMFGVHAVDLWDDDPRWERYRAALREFQRSGTWYPDPWCPLPQMPAGFTCTPEPWLVRGDERWCWRDQQWILQQAGLTAPVGLVPGVCLDRRHHLLHTEITEHIHMCTDCGYVSVSDPD